MLAQVFLSKIFIHFRTSSVYINFEFTPEAFLFSVKKVYLNKCIFSFLSYFNFFFICVPSQLFIAKKVITTDITYYYIIIERMYTLRKKSATWNPFCPVFRTLGKRGSQEGSLHVQEPKKVPYITKNGSKEPKEVLKWF